MIKVDCKLRKTLPLLEEVNRGGVAKLLFEVYEESPMVFHIWLICKWGDRKFIGNCCKLYTKRRLRIESGIDSACTIELISFLSRAFTEESMPAIGTMLYNPRDFFDVYESHFKFQTDGYYQADFWGKP
jgi:hypothetical protein